MTGYPEDEIDYELDRLEKLVGDLPGVVLIVSGTMVPSAAHMLAMLDESTAEKFQVIEVEPNFIKENEVLPFQLDDYLLEAKPKCVLEDKRPYFRRFERKGKM